MLCGGESGRQQNTLDPRLPSKADWKPCLQISSVRKSQIWEPLSGSAMRFFACLMSWYPNCGVLSGIGCSCCSAVGHRGGSDKGQCSEAASWNEARSSEACLSRIQASTIDSCHPAPDKVLLFLPARGYTATPFKPLLQSRPPAHSKQ